MAYKFFILCCVLLVHSKYIQTQEIAFNSTSTPRKQLTVSEDRQFHIRNVPYSDSLFQSLPGILGKPWWPSFIMNIIQYFYQQRHDNRDQFGVLYMGNVVNNEFDPHFDPEINGRPIIDNSNPISPSTSRDFGNYIASRPERVDWTMVHAESLLLDQLTNLWNAYNKRFGKKPNFILLYSWFMPCPNCTVDIIYHLSHEPFSTVRNRVIAYSREGLNLPYMSEAQNNLSRMLLNQNGLLYWHSWCERPGVTTAESTNAQNIEPDLSSLIMDKTTKAYSKTFFEKHVPVGEDPDRHTCQLNDTLQGCMSACLDTNLCCFCHESRKHAMEAAMINDLTLTCATTEFVECAKRWIDENIGLASGCIRHDEVLGQMEICALRCYDKPLSNPLDPFQSFFYPDLLANFSKLADFQRPDLSSFCSDIRTEGFLCSKYTSDSFTAGNTLCRSDNKCGYNQGTSYSWCYTDFSGNWDYCCTGPCIFGDGTSYLWCSSGDKWQYCGNAGLVDIEKRVCLPTFPCGMHRRTKRRLPSGAMWTTRKPGINIAGRMMNVPRKAKATIGDTLVKNMNLTGNIAQNGKINYSFASRVSIAIHCTLYMSIAYLLRLIVYVNLC